ncbi:MAG: EscU/YscU/HrcU family type III secretion system export apparatus switch protein [Deltaproteobacteria bacterium]|nr:EscU/YscU/HrcU family type III secretion system export apparatus switch protein [Deltaproteobacteria bacterium]
MADQDKQDLTEDPTAQRLDKKREEGEIPMGRDFAAVAALGLAIVGFTVSGSALQKSILTLIQHAADALPDLAGRTSSLPRFDHAFMPMVGHTLLLLVAIAIGGSAALAAQTRMQIWGKRLAPDPKKLFQLERITKVFKREFLSDILLSAAKVTALLSAVVLAVGDTFMTLPALMQLPPQELFGNLMSPLLRAAIAVFGAMAVLATIDLVVQNVRFKDKAKMTKQQVRDERKEEEGDPLIKGQRRRKHREFAQGRMEQDVPEADAIIVNPTHIAIAIRYRKEEGGAPRITCKGKDERASRMRELAKEHGIPIYKDIPLARLLHKKVKVGEEVPADTFKAVAAVLSFVYRTTGRRTGTG